jgi:hypothetical protein
MHIQILQKELYNHCAAPIFLQWKLNTSIGDNFSFQYDDFNPSNPTPSSRQLLRVGVNTYITYICIYEHNFGQTITTQNVCPEFFVAFKEAATERGW